MAICSPRRLAGWLCLLMLSAGCASTRTAPQTEHASVHGAATQQDLISSWNRSVEAMRYVEIDGTAQLEWEDDQGRHREQGDLQAWIDGGARVSLRLTKFGDVAVWLGQDAHAAWMYDLLSEPTRLTVVAPENARLAGGVPLDPRVLRLLLGFEPLPDDAEVMVQSTGRRITGVQDAMPFVMEVDQDLRPVLVQVMCGDQSIEARHRWTTGIVMPTPAGAARPCARVVDIHHGDASMLKLQMTSVLLLTASQLEEQAVVFDGLGRIQSHLTPAVVEDRR